MMDTGSIVNIGRLIEWRAFVEPDELAIREGDTALSNADFHKRILNAVSFLDSSGIRPGDRVAALLYNSSLFLELFFAAARLTAILVPLNYRLASIELEYQLQNSGISLLVADPEFRKKIEGINLGHKTQVVFPSGRDTWKELILQRKPPRSEAPGEQEMSNDTPLLIMYTSGTTGRPKGVTLSHGNVLWNAVMHVHGGFYKEKALAVVPFFHVAGLNAMATQILYGKGSLVIQKTFDASAVLDLIEREKITCMFCVPTMLSMIAKEPRFESADLSSVRYFSAGSAPVPVSIIKTFQQRGIKIRQAYGLTETSPSVCMLNEEYALVKPGSCGKEFFHVQVRIVDEHGKDVPQGQVGEMIVKGPNVMVGYWKDPEATQKVLRKGWLWTGDLAKRDADGFIYIVDRKKDLIISGGENIYPAEIEAVLQQHRDVAEVAVVGLPDEQWGEVPMAYIVLESDGRARPEDLMDYCRSRIAKFKVPKQFRYLKALPRTAAGKIDKKAIRNRS